MNNDHTHTGECCGHSCKNPNDPSPVTPTPLDTEIFFIKSFRREISNMIVSVRALPCNRERALVRTKLEEALMWLGKDLQRIGEENPSLLADPYPNANEPSTGSVIDKPAEELNL